MAIQDFIQPLTIFIEEEYLRLRKPSKDEWRLGFPWYQNPKVMYYSEGISDRTYEMTDINRMYSYLCQIGELYFIELKINEEWVPIGDATLSESNLPIVIGDESYWGQGIGKAVLKTLIERAKLIGMVGILNLEIYHYNERSKSLYTSVGFEKVKDKEASSIYQLLF